MYRQEVRPFTDKQIELVKNFAAQAVIAIENTRLLNELRQRTTDLTELLEQQTATSEVLQVISSSPGDVEPVFQAMLENAVRICDATFGNIYRWDGENLHLVAANNTPGSFVQTRARIGLHPGANDPVGRMIMTKAVVHTADLAAERDYIERRNPGIIAAVEVGGVRTLLAVPLLKDNQLIGSFHLSRQEVRPFTEKQITLVTNFAAQAVIAIENARLLTELHQRTTELTERTDDLTKALEQQTATSEVLQVISSSPGELQPVFDTMLATQRGSARRPMVTCDIWHSMPSRCGVRCPFANGAATIRANPGVRQNVSFTLFIDRRDLHTREIKPFAGCRHRDTCISCTTQREDAAWYVMLSPRCARLRRSRSSWSRISPTRR